MFSFKIIFAEPSVLQHWYINSVACYAPDSRLQTQWWLIDKTIHFTLHWVVILNLPVCTFKQCIVVSIPHLKRKREKQKRKWPAALLRNWWCFNPGGVKEWSHCGFCGTSFTSKSLTDTRKHLCAWTWRYCKYKFPKFRNSVEKKSTSHFLVDLVTQT